MNDLCDLQRNDTGKPLLCSLKALLHQNPADRRQTDGSASVCRTVVRAKHPEQSLGAPSLEGPLYDESKGPKGTYKKSY